MATRQSRGVIRLLSGAMLLRDGTGRTDEQLLKEYVGRRDEAALEALVQRKDAARYAELQKELCAKGKGPGLKKRTFARALKSVWEMEYAAKAKLPNEAGSKYVVTEAGRAVYPKIAAIRKRQ